MALETARISSSAVHPTTKGDAEIILAGVFDDRKTTFFTNASAFQNLGGCTRRYAPYGKYVVNRALSLRQNLLLAGAVPSEWQRTGFSRRFFE